MTNRKNTKRALFTSVISMLLCVTMLIGSTFAWFTDNAQTGVNSIEAGTLRVDLVDAEEKSLEGKSLTFKKAGTNEYWEPGQTWTLQDVYVKNNGNLALKYRITITGIQGDAELNEAITWTIKVGDTEVKLNNGVSQEFKLAANTKSDLLSISGHMDENAGNKYQGMKIEGISIKVEATQDTVEHDSQNNTYDEKAEYGPDYVEGNGGNTDPADVWDGTVGTLSDDLVIDGAAEFAAFAAAVNAGDDFAGKTVKLNANIDLNNQAWTSISAFAGTFDGQNNTISNLKDAALFHTVSGTVKNLNMKDASFTTASYLRDFGIMIRLANAGAVIDNCSADGLTITTTSGNDDGNSVGALIGRTVGTAENSVKVSNTTVSNVTISVSRKAKDFGGFVGGTVYTAMTDCSVENVKFIVADYYQEIGGFAAYVKYGSSFTNCDVNGLVMELTNISVGGYVGGFVGHTDVPYNEAASVPAGRNTMTFTDCDVKDMQITIHGKITGYISGFCGWTTSRGPSIATNCSVAGTIDATDTTIADSGAGLNETWYSLYVSDAWTDSTASVTINQ